MLSPPPLDATGQVLPHDHSEILPNDGIIRRISPQYVIQDQLGKCRISSMAYKPSSAELGGGLSIDLEAQIQAAGTDVKSFVSNPPWIGSVRFTAKQLRDQDFLVGYDPLIPDNPYHGEVWGTFSSSKKKILAHMAQWLVPIDGVSLT